LSKGFQPLEKVRLLINGSFKLTLQWFCLFLILLAAGCTEKVENDLGLVMMPDNSVRDLPARMELRSALEVVTVQGEPAPNGTRALVFVGRTKQYELRTVLDYLVSLPDNIEIQAAELQIYIYGVRGELPITVSAHVLTQDFTEEETTWEQAANGLPWSVPGGDYQSEPLGSAVFDGEDFDTLTIDLDTEALQAYLSGTGWSRLPLLVIGEDEDVYLRLIGRELSSDQAVASRLEIIYTEQGSTEEGILSRRPLQDATIAQYYGPLNEDRLMIGEIPATQTFFSYDFSGLPDNATVNRAVLHLSVSGGAVVDSFLVGAFAAEQAVYTHEQGDFLVIEKGGGDESDSVLVLDVTPTVQLMVLAKYSGIEYPYLGLNSYSAAMSAGFLEFYPEDWPDSLLRPYLELVYSEPMDAPLPY
jgi:hypothetical protein